MACITQVRLAPSLCIGTWKLNLNRKLTGVHYTSAGWSKEEGQFLKIQIFVGAACFSKCYTVPILTTQKTNGFCESLHTITNSTHQSSNTSTVKIWVYKALYCHTSYIQYPSSRILFFLLVDDASKCVKVWNLIEFSS